MATTVVIRDLPSNNPVDYRFAVYASNIENGRVVTLGAIPAATGDTISTTYRDVYTATAPAAATNELWLVTGVELCYKQEELIDDYLNKAGDIFRVERVKAGGTYSISSDAFTIATVATDLVKGASVVATAATTLTMKATAAGGDTVVGKVIDVFTKSGKTFATVQFTH